MRFSGCAYSCTNFRVLFRALNARFGAIFKEIRARAEITLALAGPLLPIKSDDRQIPAAYVRRKQQESVGPSPYLIKLRMSAILGKASGGERIDRRAVCGRGAKESNAEGERLRRHLELYNSATSQNTLIAPFGFVSFA